MLSLAHLRHLNILSKYEPSRFQALRGDALSDIVAVTLCVYGLWT